MRKEKNFSKSVVLETFIELVEQFQPYYDGLDRIWRFYLKMSSRKWETIVVQKYCENYYIHSEDRETIVYPENQTQEIEEELVQSWLNPLKLWQNKAFQDLCSSQTRLLRTLPLEMRMGVIPRRFLWDILPTWMRIDKDLKNKEKVRLVELLQKPEPEPLSEINLDLYLKYCEVAYRANPSTFEERLFGPRDHFDNNLSGLDYYKRYADGRHGGLLDVDPNSCDAFSKWYHSNQWQGCHPWEIYRGGNSTHIDLSVSEDRYKKGWNVTLTAFSSTRLVETCRIALAFTEAGLNFTLYHQESYLKRILAEDWIGILPRSTPIKYGWQLFPSKYQVADCIHLDWILEANLSHRRSLRNQLRSLATWLPMEVTLFPRDSWSKKIK